MGKTEKSNDEEPPSGVSPQIEASKLLEAALLEMDGIISGNSGPGEVQRQHRGVRDAAATLAAALQQCANTPSQPPDPDPSIAEVIAGWLSVYHQHQQEQCQQDGDSAGSETEDEVTFMLRLRPTPSPPTRRRRHSVDCRPVSQNKDPGWDVIIQRREVTSPPPPLPPRVLPSAPPPPTEDFHCYPKQEPFFSPYQHQQRFALAPDLSLSFPNLSLLPHYRPSYYQPSPVRLPPPVTLPPPVIGNHSESVVNSVNVTSGDGMVCETMGVRRPPASPPPARPPKPAPRTSRWAPPSTNHYAVSPPLDSTPNTIFINTNAEHDDRIRRLQGENDNLQKEVFVLNERIDAQGERIAELERVLQDKKQQLGNTEDLLQREMLSRSSLETQKLELMSALSEMKLAQAALERENLELRTQCQIINNNAVKKPPPVLKVRTSPQPQHTSNPLLHQPPSPLTTSLSQRQLTSSDLHTPKTPPATYRRQVDLHYGSLPRQQFLSNGGTISLVDSNANPTPALNGGARKGVAFGKGFTSLLGVRARGHSVPNLAETEKIIPVEEIQVPVSPGVNDSCASLSPQPSPSLQSNKNRGIKKIFGRMKRSGSGNLEDLPGEGEFRRGGVRATAGPRLGWNETSPATNNVPVIQRPDAPFSEWDNETVCDWLQDLGLDMYLQEAKRWIKNGAHLLAASAHDLEKELAIKNVLHRKKLQLALVDEQGSSSDPFLAPAGRLDTAWVLRWLDDTGLPQHKDAFLASRIDGRVLHRLTIDELATLHVTSVLHVASLRRGIQVLREQNFAPGCLTRRSLPDDPPQPEPAQVALWTTHRVMEWLRAVDLAEYAPNLRGAGVHGGLLIYETKFTAELMATLLSIPPSKTLLRRHLNTHFKELLGRDVIQEKREAETTLGYTPLTPAAKLKVTKKSQFSLKKKKDKGEQDYGDLVCPLNSTASTSGESNGSSCTSRDSVGMTKTDTPKVEVVCHLIDDPALAQDDYRRNSSPSPSPQPLRI